MKKVMSGLIGLKLEGVFEKEVTHLFWNYHPLEDIVVLGVKVGAHAITSYSVSAFQFVGLLTTYQRLTLEETLPWSGKISIQTEDFREVSLTLRIGSDGIGVFIIEDVRSMAFPVMKPDSDTYQQLAFEITQAFINRLLMRITMDYQLINKHLFKDYT